MQYLIRTRVRRCRDRIVVVLITIYTISA